ncbi:hypothetical protein L226DRAFT_573404 [Lentinus tigrinus ALCF2SS1-7]|uniref:F-box domain-containing protein n=1 Tax=Lentinus tigrinus ALCF2SS1-6 TaxID=1328759 RepID=A0A5C2S7Q1_9APHY|nr:hypothetical protein L227DRAFT_613689 [Lentinus tigrinus ALCF2SS1-6]RPD72036.1 hypothetical protein L226DRAFT_573404 [Lentinus tigrinus ALCF2SS1-7]
MTVGGGKRIQPKAPTGRLWTRDHRPWARQIVFALCTGPSLASPSQPRTSKHKATDDANLLAVILGKMLNRDNSKAGLSTTRKFSEEEKLGGLSLKPLSKKLRAEWLLRAIGKAKERDVYPATRAEPEADEDQDLLDEIFFHLTPGWDGGDEDDPNWDPSDRKLLRSTLAAAARVSRAFSKHALDGLWRVLEDIVPLLRILPCTSSRSHIRVFPDISDAAWARFQHYALRLRELKSIKPSVPAHPSAWKIIVRRLEGAPMLPMLRRLETSIMRPEWPVLLLLSPSLEWLQLSPPDDYYEPEGFSPETDGFVNSLVQHISLPSVPAEIRRKVHTVVPEASNHILSLGRFTALQDLDLYFAGIHVGQQTLQALSSLSSLRALRAHVLLHTMPSTASFRDGFPALDALSLRGTAEDFLKLLRALPLHKLTELELKSLTRTSVEEYKSFLVSVRSLIPSGLTYLTLCPDIFTRSRAALSLAELLEPMLSLRELRKLSCQFRTYPKDVSDDDLRAFATAWPKLTSFWAVYNDHILDRVQPITIAGLADLLQRCPDLESVGITTLDIGHLPSPSLVRRLNNRVWELAVHLFVGEAEADLLVFALIVDRLLPCLQVPHSIAAKSRRREWTDRLWDKVRLLVAPLQAARRIGS